MPYLSAKTSNFLHTRPFHTLFFESKEKERKLASLPERCFKLSASKTTVRTGMMAGVTSYITHCLIMAFTGKLRQTKPLTVIISLIFIARYAFITLG